MAARPDISIGAYRVWQRNRDVLLQLWKSEFVAQLIEPIIVILALGIGLGQFVELESGEDYAAFLAPGLIAMFPMFAAVFECAWGSYVRLEMQGTYNAIVATPVSVALHEGRAYFVTAADSGKARRLGRRADVGLRELPPRDGGGANRGERASLRPL